MRHRAVRNRFTPALLVLAVALAVGGCQPSEEDKAPPARAKTGEPGATVALAPSAEKEELEAPAGRGPEAGIRRIGGLPEESAKEHPSPRPKVEVDEESEKPQEELRMVDGATGVEPSPAPEETTTQKPGLEDLPPMEEAREPEPGRFTRPAPKPADDENEDDDPDAFSLDELEESRKRIEEEMAKEAVRREKEQKKRIAQLGAPLVENKGDLVRLHKVFPIWTDPKGKRVVIVGEVCQRRVPLEMFACTRHTKEHEAIVVVDGQARIVHAGLLAVGAKPGRPVQFQPKYASATGQEIEISVAWKDSQGKRRIARAQDWIRHVESKKAMEYSWVFAGSGFRKDDFSGKVYYMADGGDFICVSNFATAMLDLPVKSSSLNQSLYYEAFTERIPEEGTPVTLILTPKPGKKPPGQEKPAPDSPKEERDEKPEGEGTKG